MAYIDTNKFREFLGDMRSEYNFFDDEERPRYEAYSKALLILNEYIENEPSIDIVFCKECRHHIKSNVNGKVWCERIDGILPMDWYCADGERKDDE